MNAPSPAAATGRPTLSAAVIVYNGLPTLPACLSSLAFCDEVVVVDDCSTDGTWEWLQERPGVRAVQNRHSTMAAQRELTRDLAAGDWLLVVDSDETISPELAEAIRAAIARPDAPDGFWLRHRTPYPAPLAGETWAWKPRLLRREKTIWIPTADVHSPLDRTGVRMGRLRVGRMDHEPLPDLATAFRKALNRNLVLAAQKRRRPGAVRIASAMAWRFLKFWAGSGAWRHGRDGFVMSCLHGYAALVKHGFATGRRGEMAGATDGGVGSFSTAPASPARSGRKS